MSPRRPSRPVRVADKVIGGSAPILVQSMTNTDTEDAQSTARQVAALGSDSAQDLYPSGYAALRAPLHQVGIVAMGLCLIDNCDLEGLSATCQQLGRWSFLLSVGALRIQNGTGSPVNPIALF